jgi:hypothetical protein
MSGWLPIETAPESVFVLFYDGETIGIAELDRGYWVTVSGIVHWPTHWMPLPAPPNGTQDGTRQK